jgi:hypothetical protein
LLHYFLASVAACPSASASERSHVSVTPGFPFDLGSTPTTTSSSANTYTYRLFELLKNFRPVWTIPLSAERPDYRGG